MGSALPGRARFGVFELDLKAGELHKRGRVVLLQEQPFQILRMLVEHGGELATREEIRRKLWPNDTVVEFDHAINNAIKKLRQELGDSVQKPKYIETVGRRGYRLMMPVEWIGAAPAGVEDTSSQNGAPPDFKSHLAVMTGKKVSHYRVLEVLGGGGMGVVYKAEDIKLGRRVALKFLPEELGNDAKNLERFEREARSASAVEHPNICSIYEFGEHEGQPFIVMQLLEGQTLRERIGGGSASPPFQTDELLDLAIQVTEGLDSAHQKGIIHRDIKPANIFITNRGEVKILDFGLAKLTDAQVRAILPSEAEVNGLNSPLRDATEERAVDPGLTRTGVALGTAAYMSPEQVRGEKLDRRTDLFSFGLVLYEMATGRPAFSGQTTAILHAAILNDTPTQARKSNPELPAKLEQIISKAVEKNREMRYQSAAELRADLQKVAAGLRRQTDGVVKASLYRRPSVMISGIFLILLMSAAAFWIVKRQSTLPSGLPELNQRQLTDNSSENASRERRLTSNPVDNPVQGTSAISTDGRYLAYADRLGIHVQTIETGETTRIPQPEGFDPKSFYWSIAAWFPSNQEFLANAEPAVADRNVSIWVVGLTSAPRKLKDDAEAFSVSPDGGLISFVPHPASPGLVEYDGRATRIGERDIWLMGPHGEAPRKLLQTSEGRFLERLDWARDGRHFIYSDRDNDSITVFSGELSSSSRIPLSFWTTYKGLRQLIWLRDGRVLYLSEEPGYSESTCNLWQQRVNPRTGQALERPVRVVNWNGLCFYSLSASADSKRLAFVRQLNQTSIAIADLTALGRKDFAPVPFTQSEGWNSFLDWTADSKGVLFASDRNGKWQIFLQSVGAEDERALVAGRAAFGLSLTAVWGTGSKLSPDDRWLLYFVYNARDPAGKTQVLMRVPVGGGVAERITDAARSATLVCSKVKGGSCVIEELTPDQNEIVFTALNPLKGRGREIARLAVALLPNEQHCALDDVCYPWSLSPDGGTIAVHGHKSSHFELISTDTGRRSSFNVHGWSLLDFIPWDPGKDGLFVSAVRGHEVFVLRVGLNGETQVILREASGLIFPYPSPDSRLLALMRHHASKNVWMIDNF